MSEWPDNDQLISQLRAWLDETQREASAVSSNGDRSDTHDRPVGLYELIEQFTALRHEVKLQTKSARSLEQQYEKAVDIIQEAAGPSGTAEADTSEIVQRTARPYVESLIDLDESMRRGKKVIDNVRRQLLEEFMGQLQSAIRGLDALFAQLPWWRKWMCRPWHRAVKKIHLRSVAEDHQSLLGSLVDGYELIQKRLQKALGEAHIQRIDCVGQPVDPTRMTVVEVVDDPYLVPGQVVEEIRSGYCWHGKVFRFAEVRAAKER